MANVTLYVPDALYERMVGELPATFNWSAVFQAQMADALARIAGCRHRVIRCEECGAELARAELARPAGGAHRST